MYVLIRKYCLKCLSTSGGRVRKWFQIDDALDVLRSRPNYPKFEPFQSACAAARKISISASQSPSSIGSSRETVSSDDEIIHL